MKLRVYRSFKPALCASVLICCTAAQAIEVTYQYYRFTPTKMRDDVASSSIQLAEFNFLRAGEPVDQSTVEISNPTGSTPAAEVVTKLIDGNPATKWLDFHKSSVVFDFGTATAVDGYRFTTGNDSTERDPVRWQLEGSNDGSTWTLLDYRASDFATPTARLTVTPDILLPAVVVPDSFTWNGGESAEWNTTDLNWGNGTSVSWDNDRFDIAKFTAAGPKAIAVTKLINVRALDFTVPGYTISGNSLILRGIPSVTTSGDTEISSTIGGNVGFVKLGPGKLTLSGDNTFTGNTSAGGALSVRDGELVFTGTNVYGNKTSVVGGTLTYEGTGKNTVLGSLVVGDTAGPGIFNIRDMSSLAYNGTPTVGTGIGGAGSIRQSGGAVAYAQDGSYLTIANSSTSYGSYELTGGTVTTGTGAGIRIGWAGRGVFTQTGGSVTSGRWFVVGGPNGTGVATFKGGTMTTVPAYRMIGGDQVGAYGVMNIGTAAGGNAVVSPLRTATGANDGAIVLGNPAGASGQINLNSGVLKLQARVYQGGGIGRVALNGGTVQAGLANVELMNNSLSSARIFRGGVTVDTAGFAASISTNLTSAGGQGVYLPGGTLATLAGEGGSGYLGAPIVTVITDGSGTGASAIANVENGVVTGVTLTNPGENYEVGDTLTFFFEGGGTLDGAFPFDRKLLATDLAPNNTGTFKKSGAGTLTLTGSPSYTGPTLVAAGTLSAGPLGKTAITVASGATLTGNLSTQGSVMVEGTFAPGQGVGLASGKGLSFAAGSTYAFQIADWDGAAGSGYDTAQFDTVATTATAGGKLTIAVDGTGIVGFSETSRSFVIATATTAPTGFTAANYQVATTNLPGTGTWSLAVAGNTLVLSYTAGAGGGFAAYLAGFPELADTTATGDPDNDGIANLLEYVLNGDPTASSVEVLPSSSLKGGVLEFTFNRRADSKSDTTQVAEFSTDLITWTGVTIPAATAAGVTIVENTPNAGLEKVTVTSPLAPVNGKVFARLRAVKP